MKELLVGACALALTLAPPAAIAQETPVAPQKQNGVEDMSDIVKLAQAWLDSFPDGNFAAFPGKVSPDFVLRLPFVPKGVPTEFRGRETAQAALAGSARGRSKLIFENVKILRTEDPELVLTTADAEARMANGKTYRNSYIMLTRIRDGEVLEHIEYLNPLAVMESMGD